MKVAMRIAGAMLAIRPDIAPRATPPRAQGRAQGRATGGIAVRLPFPPVIRVAIALFGLSLLTACNFDLGGEAKYPAPRQKPGPTVQYEEDPGVFGTGGIFGPDLPEDQGGGGIGVNNLLWRASLDTVSFMPLVSADPFGGVIITDWYTPPSAPDERFKVNIYILGRALRADGVRASVFRQQQQGAGWIDAPVALNTATDLENAILTRARQMRQAGTQ